MSTDARGAVLHAGSGSGRWAIFTGVVAFAILGGIGGWILSGSPKPLHLALVGLLGTLGVLGIPWQIAEARRRRHELTEFGLHVRSGVIGRFDVEVPYSAIRGVTVHQGIWQRAFGCADVRVAVPGISGAKLISSRDYNSIVLRSVADFEAVADLLRRRMGPSTSP